MYVYSLFYYMTSHGTNIRLAQYIFVVLYLLTVMEVVYIHHKLAKVSVGYLDSKLPVFRSLLYLCLNKFLFLSVRPSVSVFVCICLYLSVCFIDWLLVCFSVHWSVYLSVNLSQYLCLSVSIYLSICLLTSIWIVYASVFLMSACVHTT